MKTWLRPYVRKVLTPILRYAIDTPVIMGEKSRVIVGERVALANTLLNVASGTITIGDRSIFSPNVMVLTGRHEFLKGMRVSMHPEFDDGSWGGSKHEVPKSGFDVKIGNGVWIGAGAIILSPVEIGDNSIVAAGAVVTKSFPQYSVIAGVPAAQVGSTLDRSPSRLTSEIHGNE